MNINNLELKTYKNYKELCTALEIKVEAGNSKAAQLKDLECYCKYRRDKHKYIIDEVYQVPLERIVAISSNNLYCEDIQVLIMSMLVKESKKTVNISCNKLLEALCMVNYNYIKGESNITSLSKVSNIPITNCMDFYVLSRDNMKRKIETALNILHRKKCIYYEKVTFIDLNIKVGDEVVREHRKITIEEKEILLTVEQEVIKENNWSMPPYFSPLLYIKFKNEVKAKMKEFGIDMNYSYRSYEITFNKVYLKEHLDEVIYRLNSNIIKSVISEAETRHNRACKKVDEIIEKDEDDDKTINVSALHFGDDYITNVRYLTDLLIKRDADIIYFNEH